MFRTLPRAALLTVLCFSSFPAHTAVPTLPDSMAALGDSISSGAFANFKWQWGTLPWAQVAFFETLGAYIASGGNARTIERRYLSWTTGLDPLLRVNSHARRLQKMHDDAKDSRRLTVHNFAQTGALGFDLFSDQTPDLMQWSRRALGQDAPDYVTMLVGANDVCDGTEPDAAYLSRLDRTLKDLLEKSPRTRVLVLAIPRLERLSENFASQPLTRGPVAGTCGELWQITQVCPRILLERDKAKLGEVGELVRRYNEGLRGLAQDAATRYGDRVRFSNASYEVNFEASDLSMDCFHPGPNGQARLAELTWRDTWWADRN